MEWDFLIVYREIPMDDNKLQETKDKPLTLFGLNKIELFVCRYRPASLEWFAEAGGNPDKQKLFLCELCRSVVNKYFWKRVKGE